WSSCSGGAEDMPVGSRAAENKKARSEDRALCGSDWSGRGDSNARPSPWQSGGGPRRRKQERPGRSRAFFAVPTGAVEPIRTPDLLLGMVLLYPRAPPALQYREGV